MSSLRRVIGIMAKAPIAGQAKTRLAPRLGAGPAAALYGQMLLDSIDLARAAMDGEAAISIVCPDPAHGAMLARLVPASVTIVAHERCDLMAGLDYALSYYVAEGWHQVILFNGDTPTLPATYLREAFDRLTSDSVVLGPTFDGGYYLIGACAPQPALFDWEEPDSATICRRTIERAAAAGTRVALLPPWYDIDTADDLAQLVEELLVNQQAAPRTRAFLAGQGYL